MNSVPDHIVNHLAKDPIMADIMSSCKMDYSFRPMSVFDALLKSIVSQQLSVKAAATIYGRFMDALDQNASIAKQVDEMDIEALRALGLSYQKAGYIKNVVTFFDVYQFDVPVWEELSDDEIIEKLTQIKGVGKWTVEMMLIFVLGREDVLPLDDLIIKTHIVKRYDVTSTKKQLIVDLEAIAEPWRPYRSIACRYLWAAKDSAVF